MGILKGIEIINSNFFKTDIYGICNINNIGRVHVYDSELEWVDLRVYPIGYQKKEDLIFKQEFNTVEEAEIACEEFTKLVLNNNK